MNATLQKLGKALLIAATVLTCPRLGSASGAENYLSALQKAIAQTRHTLAQLTQSANHAADQFISGGNLWVAGRQADFISEACGRAGGLTAIAPLAQRVPSVHDVILYAVPGSPNSEDRKTIDRWRRQGATVIQFSSAAGLYRNAFPIDTVVNIVDQWTWTGEFVAACTRRGRMPVLYQSYGLPGGLERGKKYRGKRFHDDLTIKPIPAEVLGREYLDQIEGMLAKIDRNQMPHIAEAAKWLRQATSVTVLFTGHMFPSHVEDPRSVPLGRFSAVPAWEDKYLLDASHPPQCVLYIGYQFTPRKLIEQAKAMRVRLVYSDVQPFQPPEPSSNILYIDPGWPLADGCVKIPGYDVPILPASGVLQAAIYWSIASDREP